MLLSLYRGITALARPLLMRKLRRRGVAEPLYLHAVHQRFGEYTEQERQQAQAHAGQWVWVHAVSLGETRAAGILIAALRQAYPNMHLLLTHGTATGLEEGRKLLREGDMQVWQPWDSIVATRAFVQLFQPRVGLIMETEIWPHLLQACHAAGVPVALVNARMSDKTLRQSQRFAGTARRIYSLLNVAYAQTPTDAERLQQLGVQRVVVTGNLKFDAEPRVEQLQQAQQWLLVQRLPIVLLASSREGEEAQWLQHIRPDQGVQWMVVPRHPQRFDEVAQLAQSQGWQVQRRSQWATDTPLQPDGQTLWLGDSMGEMHLYYGLADAALMGGSFAPLGGQNLIEACACGRPVLLGPHTFNFAQASEQALAEGAAWRCADMAEAVQDSLALVRDKEKLTAMQQASLAFAQRHRGAAQRMVNDLNAYLT